MRTVPAALLAATALVAITGCAKKRPPQLPPPPQQSNYDPNGADPRAGGDPDGGAAATLDAEFRRSVTSNTVNFAVDQFDIDPRARAILDSQAEWLARHPQVHVTIEGHCDERGTREYNLGLGDRRANSAKNYLAARGVDPARMATISYGSERPTAQGSDEQSWAQNRRAVTVVLN